MVKVVVRDRLPEVTVTVVVLVFADWAKKPLFAPQPLKATAPRPKIDSSRSEAMRLNHLPPRLMRLVNGSRRSPRASGAVWRVHPPPGRISAGTRLRDMDADRGIAVQGCSRRQSPGPGSGAVPCNHVEGDTVAVAPAGSPARDRVRSAGNDVPLLGAMGMLKIAVPPG